jgi:low affinity Fe/Cu permease
MINPAFIVDGFTERNIIQNICPGAPIRRTDLNGKDVSIEAMAKKIASLIRVLNNRHYPIIILVDKESRSISCKEMINKLEETIRKEGITNLDLRVGVADRMLENWIIADWDKLKSKKAKPSSTDCINGCGKLKEIIGSYGKTTDCVDMFLNADIKKMYKNSPSFKVFADKIADIDCDYINKLGITTPNSTLPKAGQTWLKKLFGSE